MAARIRLITPDDAAALTDLLVRSRDFLAPWEPIRDDDYFTVGGQHAEIGASLARHTLGEAMPLVIVDDDGEVAGRLTLSGIVRGAFQSCSMGYWLGERRTGRGLATEAVGAALELAFADLALHRVQAETLVANQASQRVLARNGFERYGLAPRYLKIAGSWQDCILFQRLTE